MQNAQPKHSEEEITDIVAAIQNNQITIAKQGIKQRGRKEIKKYEVLARLKIGDKKISPEDFILYARENGVYDCITRRVVELSFKHFDVMGDDIEKFSINLSFDDISSVKTQQFLRDELKKYNLHSKIIFELTEDAELTKSGATKSFMDEFKGLGCEFALDDFGKGYATFDPLLNLDFDYIKLDKLIIANFLSTPKLYYTIDMLSQFSKRLKYKTVAEFVQKDMIPALEAMEIDYLQGFGVIEPIDIP